MIARLDEAIRCRIFQPIADWSTDRFDRSCYWLAGQCAVAIIATTAPMGARCVADDLGWLAPIVLLAAAVNGGVGWARSAALERRFRADPLRPPLPPLPTDSWTRLYFLALVAFDCVVADGAVHLVEDLLFDAAYIAHFYFIACLPRLPRPRKERVPAHLVAQGVPS